MISSRQHTEPVTHHSLLAVLVLNIFLLPFLFFQGSQCAEEVEANEMHLKQRSSELEAPAPAETWESIQTYTIGHASAVSGSM